ncbi:ergosterol biosynthesis protein-like protein Erg28 [Lophiotrema nucula]|uniref:Ergosterol biosynthesis protein-like protein Erg28 n=1 Tax=Lophiotrema nucula TaxID=690887 RepID=A0A6A5YTY3_9PLEO|nr:ergosterol biosynthesis protein-like protein Erg28 [Lophiotrema nucula]
MSPNDGYLPYWLVFTSILALAHSIICYIASPQTSLKQFSGPNHPPPTPLLAHIYGIKNVYTALIRLYAAMNVGNRELYDLALLTYVGVLFMSVTEMFVWKTMRGKEAAFPLFNAGVGLVWMIGMRGWYVGA